MIKQKIFVCCLLLCITTIFTQLSPPVAKNKQLIKNKFSMRDMIKLEEIVLFDMQI